MQARYFIMTGVVDSYSLLSHIIPYKENLRWEGRALCFPSDSRTRIFPGLQHQPVCVPQEAGCLLCRHQYDLHTQNKPLESYSRAQLDEQFKIRGLDFGALQNYINNKREAIEQKEAEIIEKRNLKSQQGETNHDNNPPTN